MHKYDAAKQIIVCDVNTQTISQVILKVNTVQNFFYHKMEKYIDFSQLPDIQEQVRYDFKLYSTYVLTEVTYKSRLTICTILYGDVFSKF